MSDRDTRIVELAASGVSYREIGERVGLSARRVAQIARPALGRVNVSCTEGERVDRIRALHARGMSDYRIAREIGVPRDVVTYTRKRLGLPPSLAIPHERWAATETRAAIRAAGDAIYDGCKAAHAEAVRLFAAGETFRTAAKRTKLSRSAVAGAVRRAKLRAIALKGERS